MTITNGRGTLGRIYDRLRKASQRKLTAHESNDNSLADLLGQIAHDHYVRGVREALKAVEKEPSTTCDACGWEISHKEVLGQGPTT